MNLLLHSASNKKEIPSFGTQITLARIKSRVHGGEIAEPALRRRLAHRIRGKKIPSLPQRNSHGTPDPGSSESQPNPTLETLQSNQEAPLPVGGRRWAAAGSQSRSRRQGERGEIPLPCLAQLALMEMVRWRWRWSRRAWGARGVEVLVLGAPLLDSSGLLLLALTLSPLTLLWRLSAGGGNHSFAVTQTSPLFG